MVDSTSRSSTVLPAALRLLRPVARLLLRHGVAYPAFAAALKQVFVDAARDELTRTGQKQTDSAVSLLSGVHRRDVRTLGQVAAQPSRQGEEPLNLASQVVARWLGGAAYQDIDGTPLTLPRYGDAPSFDSLVCEVSSDIRPRAVLAELERLGMAEHADRQVRLLAPGFVPKQGFAEMVALLRDNAHDHLAAATLNLDSQNNYLEQAVFVDDLTVESARHLHAVAAKAWRQALRTVLREAQDRFEHDQTHATPAQRVYRARFGSYFYAANHDDEPL